MHLVTFDDGSGTAIGVLSNAAGRERIADLRLLIPGLATDMLLLLQGGKSALAQVRDALPSAPLQCWIDASAVKLRAPIQRPGKIICVGHNYHDHAGLPAGDLPEYPTFFSKFSSAVVGSGENIVLPRVSSKVDNEAELAVVIGKPGRHIAQASAMDHVAGYTILNDVSARDYQKRTSQWMMGKTFDTFAPMGPALVTADALADVNDLVLTLSVNGIEIQRSSTRHFIFPIAFLISYLSEVMTLEPGDVISTGTPARLGEYREQPLYMKPGDEVRISIDGIGTLINRFVGE